MNADTAWIMIPLLGYLIGSLPFGYLCGKIAAGMDIRRQGSGNIGATNVARVLGPRWGVLVLLLDLLKGSLSVLLLPQLAPVELRNDLSVWAGFSAIIGHMYPLWLRFNGGKGVATALGVVIPLSPWGSLAAAAVFLTLVGMTRFVSVGSMTAVATFAVVQFVRTGSQAFTAPHLSLTLFSLIAPGLIIIAHRKNLERLWRGEESKLGSAKKKTTAD